MDLDRIPGWLKALAASLWTLFVLAPFFAWLMHQFGDAAGLLAAPIAAATYVIFCARGFDEDISDAEYYRRKAAAQGER